MYYYTALPPSIPLQVRVRGEPPQRPNRVRDRVGAGAARVRLRPDAAPPRRAQGRRDEARGGAQGGRHRDAGVCVCVGAIDPPTPGWVIKKSRFFSPL